MAADYLSNSLVVVEIIIIAFMIDALVRTFAGKGFLMPGEKSGGGGGGGGFKSPFSWGNGKKSAAEVAADDQAALQEESAEAKERTAEIAEEAREMSDLRAIRGITDIERKTWEGIKGVIKTLIKRLQNRAKAKTIGQEFTNEIIAKVGEIIQYSHRLQQEDQNLDAKIRELAALEITEKAIIGQSFVGTKKEVQEAVKANKAAGRKGKGPNTAAWVKIKGKFETDAEKRIADQIKVVQTNLLSHRKRLSDLEKVFTGYFTQAEAALRGNNIPRAILQLEAAYEDIDAIQKLLKEIGGHDVNRIQADIKRRISDLQRETKLSVFTQIGLQQQRKAAVAAKKGVPLSRFIGRFGRKGP